MWIEAIAWLSMGIVIGFLARSIIEKVFGKPCIGVLRVDHSIKEEPPYLFLELHENPEKLSDGSHVTMQVHFQDFVPQ